MLKTSQRLVLMLIVVVACNLALPKAWAVPINVLPLEQEELVRADTPVATQAESAPRAKIPEHPVHMYIKKGQESHFELFFLDVKYDSDLVDFETYKAWCLQKGRILRRDAMHEINLYNCYDPNIPEQFRRTDWNRVNYIINHKKGSQVAVQEAIWALCDAANKPTSKDAILLLDESAERGRDFRPAEGELLGVIGYPEGKQPVFIEFLLPKSETFAVAPAFFEPALAAISASATPSLLPLAPLAVIPAIPFVSTGPPPTPPPPPPPIVPEPVTFFLFGSGFGCMIMWRLISIRRRK